LTYSETIEQLHGIRLFGQRLGLETMRDLCRQLGHPERQLRFLHIAGTNGKGSVAAMCHAALTAAGYRTGLYTSPHLVSFCERFQINQQPIAEADVVRLVAELLPQPSATFFEVVTALALRYFAEQHVEVVVWETGLGGRLDATNVVTPLVSVITNIGFDHMQYLGDTLEQIAGEKAGIIKPGIPVVTGVEGAALEVIRRVAAEQHAPLTVVNRADAVLTPLIGAHQVINSAIAVATLRSLNVPPNFATTRWPGRFQIVGRYVLDGAHNPAAAEQLAVTLREQFPGKQIALVLGVLRDKDYAAACRILAPLAGTIACARVNSERTCDPGELAALCRAANPTAEVHAYPGVTEALAATNTEVVVITGSLFLVGEAMTLLGVSTATTPRELVLQ